MRSPAGPRAGAKAAATAIRPHLPPAHPQRQGASADRATQAQKHPAGGPFPLPNPAAVVHCRGSTAQLQAATGAQAARNRALTGTL